MGSPTAWKRSKLPPHPPKPPHQRIHDSLLRFVRRSTRHRRNLWPRRIAPAPSDVTPAVFVVARDARKPHNSANRALRHSHRFRIRTRRVDYNHGDRLRASFTHGAPHQTQNRSCGVSRSSAACNCSHCIQHHRKRRAVLHVSKRMAARAEQSWIRRVLSFSWAWVQLDVRRVADHFRHGVLSPRAAHKLLRGESAVVHVLQKLLLQRRAPHQLGN
mmetsp:Transcript_3590/g.7848  ORF Transcript_3590/g.7848 Transcript_3590/m.7848 type:complete len:216 (-) Transcript_3590:241-888(-)